MMCCQAYWKIWETEFWVEEGNIAHVYVARPGIFAQTPVQRRF